MYCKSKKKKGVYNECGYEGERKSKTVARRDCNKADRVVLQ